MYNPMLTPRRFTVPKITLDLDDLSESQERAIVAEGLDVQDVKPVLAGPENAPISQGVDEKRVEV